MIEGWECWGCIWDYINPFTVGVALFLFGGGAFLLGYIFGVTRRGSDDTDKRLDAKTQKIRVMYIEDLIRAARMIAVEQRSQWKLASARLPRLLDDLADVAERYLEEMKSGNH